ncbi:acyl-CoA Delta(11) desaturase-like isoform X2 [Agrilus planipennis]|uniref:Acyl-CoA Delta(11) desaturase-like isoform X2 n=1 Tax=Agrilus planipennis TaxID=224129 RepID=A0A7F5R4N7_AGRPL|nr:acyl-CoA Delta(11) desaturase-like isoform X2 [Agrilus planipennis]
MRPYYENNLYNWVRDHRVHHKFSETVADPHNANRGFFFSHVGWLMMKKHPQVIEKGKKINMDDLFEDPVAAFLIRNFWWLKLMMCFFAPSVVPHVFWGETWYWSVYSQAVCRYVLNLNFTWLVNSIAHMWGNRPYDKAISPSENFVVSLLSIGEGWHNYHHTFPWDYRAAELGKFSVTTFWLNLFAKIGWAYDLKIPSDNLVRMIAENRGDGTYVANNHLAHAEIHDLDINGNIRLRRT